MADDTRVSNWPSSGTPAAVALELTKIILREASDPSNRKTIYGQDNVLAVYGACLKAARGDYEYRMESL